MTKAQQSFVRLGQRATAASAKITKALSKPTNALLALGAAAITASKAFDLAFDASKFKQAEQGFANLAASYGVNSKLMIDSLRRVSAGTISTANIMESASTALLLGIPADKLTNLMEIARASARVTGQSVQAAFNDIAKGLGRQSKLILDNLGIVVSAGKANKAYAEEMNIVGRELTDLEKKQAFTNAALKSGNEIVERIAIQGKTAAEAMETFKAKTADVGIFAGKVLASAGFAIAGILNLVSVTFATLLTGASNTLGKFLGLFEKIPKIGKTFKSASDALLGFGKVQGEIAAGSLESFNNNIKLAASVWKNVEANKALTQAKREDEVVAPPEDKLAGLQLELDTELSIRSLFFQKRLDQENVLTSALQTNARIHAMAEKARANVVGVAYKGMEDAALRLLETGKLSLGAMGKVVAQQVKIELLGIAVRSAVQAVYQTALGLGTAILFPSISQLHFASAATFAKTAALAGGAAVVTQAAFGGSATRPAPGTVGGEPIITTPEGASATPSQAVSQRGIQSITVNIVNPLSEGNWDAIASDIVDTINRGGDEQNLELTIRTAEA
jgi:tRNA A37 threonylcarbamoyladenosine synthetase subunit TsaC/SUA5/YrdC